jgi:hypothetical protein
MLAQKRVPKRSSVLVKGVLECKDLSQDVFLRDLSVDGARLDISRPLAVFEIATLICGDSRMNGIVAWSNDEQLGMEFSEPLNGQTLVGSADCFMRVTAPKNYRFIRVSTDFD